MSFTKTIDSNLLHEKYHSLNCQHSVRGFPQLHFKIDLVCVIFKNIRWDITKWTWPTEVYI